MDKYNDQPICFGIHEKLGRMLLNISQLINIKNNLLNSIQAIQLFKYIK